jgi:hypothetical protein
VSGAGWTISTQNRIQLGVYGDCPSPA